MVDARLARAGARRPRAIPRPVAAAPRDPPCTLRASRDPAVDVDRPPLPRRPGPRGPSWMRGALVPAARPATERRVRDHDADDGPRGRLAARGRRLPPAVRGTPPRAPVPPPGRPSP